MRWELVDEQSQKEKSFKEIEELMNQENSNNLFFEKRSSIFNKVAHAYNTGSDGAYDELMAITKALRYKKEHISEEESFRRLLEEFNFIEQTTPKGLTWKNKELYEELIKEYGKPKEIEPEFLEKNYKKNLKIHWGNIILGGIFVVLLLVIFFFLR